MTVAVFKWTPANKDIVRVGFVATDGRANSVALPEVRLCDCQNGGICNFDKMVDNSDIVNNKFAVSGDRVLGRKNANIFFYFPLFYF